MATKVKIIFGGGGLRPERGFPDYLEVQKALDILEANGIDTIDTARLYGPSETFLGQAGAGQRFTLDTKVPGGFIKGSLAVEKLKESVAKSLQELKVDKVNVFYFHTPDIDSPLEPALAAVDALYRAGTIAAFGLSNFLAAGVEEVHALCTAKGYVRPTVYQGNYNPLARRQETELLPTLRRLGIAFYAYSPIAGGFLAKTKADVLAGQGRFQEGSSYFRLYANEAFLEALGTWADIAREAGCGAPAELAYRWVLNNSALKGEFGDALLVGANGVGQLKETLAWLAKGPLDEATCAKIDKFWEAAKAAAPLDNFNL